MEKTEAFRVRVNGQFEFDAHSDDARSLDLIQDRESGQFHILHNNHSYRAEFLESDPSKRQYVLRINGNKYTVNIADHYERLVQQLGLQVGGTQKMNSIKAPMPGLVLNILVEPGQAVQKGDPLLLLEAMKMENVIKAAGEGTVKTVAVQKGAAVDKGQLLLEME